MQPRTILAVFLVGLCFALPARADDEPAASVTQVVDLERYHLPPAAVGPRLAIPPDLIQVTEDKHGSGIWDVDWTYPEKGTWLPFATPYLEGTALSLESVVTVLRATLARSEALAENLEIEEADEVAHGLRLRGPPEAVALARRALPWVLEGLAPSIEVRAILTAQAGSGPYRLEAVGRARLWPGRWTRIYLQESEVPCAPLWDLEVAQESTVMDPMPVLAREGHELYMRFHPGETRSLVEVWAGRVEHLEIVKQDLTAVRNLPEANGAAVISYPRSAVDRAFTEVLVPAGASVETDLRWENRARRVQLRLALGTAPRPVAAWPREGQNALALLRTGALVDALEYQTRSSRVDAWCERVQNLLYARAAQRERAGGDSEFSVSSVDGGSVFFVEAPAEDMEALRTLVADAEANLVACRARVRLLAVPEPAYRKALIEGRIDLGRPVAEDVLAAFREAGAVAGEGLDGSALEDVPVGFRVGRSEPGLADFDAELAQSSGGLMPLATARFAGIFGELRVRRTDDGRAVGVRGALCWADPAAGTVEMTFRKPIPIRPKEGPPSGERERENARVSFPVLGGGHTAFDRTIELPPAGADDVLAHACVREDEVLLLLVSVR